MEVTLKNLTGIIIISLTVIAATVTTLYVLELIELETLVESLLTAGVLALIIFAMSAVITYVGKSGE